MVKFHLSSSSQLLWLKKKKKYWVSYMRVNWHGWWLFSAANRLNPTVLWRWCPHLHSLHSFFYKCEEETIDAFPSLTGRCVFSLWYWDRRSFPRMEILNVYCWLKVSGLVWVTDPRDSIWTGHVVNVVRSRLLGCHDVVDIKQSLRPAVKDSQEIFDST